MSELTVTKMTAGTAKQKLTFVPNAPNTCIFPAPPPPAGPKGIPTPFPITCDTGKIDEKPVANVKHKGGKVPNTDTIFKGIKGNQPGVGDMPPGTPKKDIITGVVGGRMQAIAGCPNCKVGGKSFVWFGSPAMGNIK